MLTTIITTATIARHYQNNNYYNNNYNYNNNKTCTYNNIIREKI